MADRPLGRRPPTDDEHIRRYPLTVAALPQLPVPVVIGVNWYTDFDDPVQIKHAGRTIWVIGRDPQRLGTIRGGHAVCLKPAGMTDRTSWWRWMDQGSEGACVEFAWNRTMMMLNRRRYLKFWLYREAQKIDEWPGENYDGTSVRAGGDVLRDVGNRRVWGSHVGEPNLGEGIAENRWAKSVDEILTCLQSPRYEQWGMVPFLNSWGTDYPHLTYMPLGTLDRLIREDGEATIITDR